MKVKDIFKPLNGHVFIHSKGEEKKDKILTIPDSGSYNKHRSWEEKDNIVVAIGEDITKVKVGDKVILAPATPMRKADFINKMIEEKTGVKTTKDIMVKYNDKNKKESKIGEEQIEKYFAILEDNILAIIK